MLVKHSVCGDASIAEKPTVERNNRCDADGNFDDEFMRSGSKPVPGEIERFHNQHESGSENIHKHHDIVDEEPHWFLPGLLRFKPGRGDKSMSMSCSDKYARWNFLGFQGCLLSYFLNDIFLSSVTIGDHFNLRSIRRALSLRTESDLSYDNRVDNIIKIYHTDIPFIHRRDQTLVSKSSDDVAIDDSNITIKDDVKPIASSRHKNQKKLVLQSSSSNSLNWYSIDEQENMNVEVVSAPGGKKMGTIAKNFNSPKQRSRLCKYMIFETFIKTAQSFDRLLNTKDEIKIDWESLSYEECRNKMSSFKEKEDQFILMSSFRNWVKPDHKYIGFHYNKC
eukprot:TRINITY_DN3464_c0_g1_i7.p1 TRINITY_DN3464_c0_g1~~TRINITY_DN3464_c0_g1_i7.p1  ORF type:complete len:336 (+),score=51.48 TRINITY_DN3464_c0_g1_i7:334-1341(+)